MSAASWFRARPVDPDAARAALEGMREELDDARQALAVAIVMLNVLAERRVPPRACDLSAEQHVLGWLLSGRADVDDFNELDAYDLAHPAHRWIYAIGLELLETWKHGVLGGQPWPAELLPNRETVRRIALLELHDNRSAARRHAELRTKIRVKTYHRRCRDILHVLARLPYPERAPRREIDLVAALGRGWSVVDQTYNVEPCEAQQ